MGFPKIRGTILGVPIIRIIIFLGSILGLPLFRETTMSIRNWQIHKCNIASFASD